MYRSIQTETWTDPVFRAFTPHQKLLFCYSITNPHSHLSGIYYLPLQSMQQETGISGTPFKGAWEGLLTSARIQYDTDCLLIWVVNMLEYQGKGHNIEKGVATHLRTLHDSVLIPQFLVRYPSILPFYKQKGVGTPSEAPSSSPSPDPDPDSDPSSVSVLKRGNGGENKGSKGVQVCAAVRFGKAICFGPALPGKDYCYDHRHMGKRS